MMLQSATFSNDSASEVYVALNPAQSDAQPYALGSTNRPSEPGSCLPNIAEQGTTHSPRALKSDIIPACSLPTEVLSEVFGYIRASKVWVLVSREPMLPRQIYFHWLAITQVCRSWRRVAIGYGALWAELSGAPGEPWDVFLRLARSNPLYITMTLRSLSPSLVDQQRNQLICQHFHHVRELHLSVSEVEAVASLDSMARAAARAARELQVLSLRLTTPCVAPPVIPSSFLELVPALRKIELNGCVFSWNTKFENLRSLRITGPDLVNAEQSASDESLPADIKGIFRCLQHMPRLERLFLSRLSPSVSALNDFEVLTLPCLRSISLSGVFQSCLHIWHLIQPHPHANIWISGHRTSIVPETCIQDALSSLRAHITSPDCLPLTDVCFHTVDFVDNFLIEVSMHATLPYTDDRWANYTIIELKLGVASPQAFFREFCTKVPLHNTSTLYLSFLPDLPLESWCLLFSATQNFKTMTLYHITEDSMAALCSALTPVGTLGEDTRNRTLAPHLDCLKLSDIDLDSPAGEDSKTVFSYLMKMLKARKKALCNLQVLSIEVCIVRTHKIERFRQIVSNVEWDGECEGD